MVDHYTNLLMNQVNWLSNLENLQPVLIAPLIFFVFLLLRKVFSHRIFGWLLSLSKNTRHDLDDKILVAFEKPLHLLFIVLGIYLALMYLSLPLAFDAFITRIFRSFLIIIIAWGLYSLCGNNSLLSEELKEKFNMDTMLIPFFSNAVKFVIVAMALVIIAQEWDYDVNGFIAGLGLGGLALALAAKDAVANIFGGIVIIMEKPFVIGDWIATSTVDGFVEDITFRSTKIRSLSQSLITIPNSTLAAEVITNHSKMGKRRINFYLGVTYDTSRNKLETCVERIRKLLQNHPDIHPETIQVYFEVFNDSSLDIYINCFTNTTVLSEHLAVKEDVNLKIMKILEEEKVSVAFPTRSIYIEPAAAK